MTTEKVFRFTAHMFMKFATVASVSIAMAAMFSLAQAYNAPPTMIAGMLSGFAGGIIIGVIITITFIPPPSVYAKSDNNRVTLHEQEPG